MQLADRSKPLPERDNVTCAAARKAVGLTPCRPARYPGRFDSFDSTVGVPPFSSAAPFQLRQVGVRRC